MRMLAPLTLLATVGLLASCTPGAVIAEELSGCQAVDSGGVASVAVGLVNSGAEPITLTGVEAQRLENGSIVDRWAITGVDEPDAAIFGGDRAAAATEAQSMDGAALVDLAGTVLGEGDGVYVALAVRRDGPGDTLLEVVDITTDSETVSAPVRLLLADDCD